MAFAHIQTRLRPHLKLLLPGLVCVGLMLVWAVDNGGYDADTWYWGALVLLAVLAAVVAGFGPGLRLSRLSLSTLAALGLYVGWSYLSIAWAQSPGDALQGSNRALLYLLLFSLVLVLPWTPEAALAALLIFVLGVGVLGFVLLVRLASADHVARLIIGGRLAAPTGYFNSTVALFTLNAITAIALAARRELPGLLRGSLIAIACAGLELAVIVQSRGWLFTLPLVAIVAVAVVRDRLRVIAAAIIPIAAALAPLRRLLDVYQSSPGPALDHAAARAGQLALLISGAMFVAASLIAWGEALFRPRALTPARRRRLGTIVAVVALVGAVAGGVAATHGHPFRFMSRQWNGFSHIQRSSSSGSHFADVGSGRYDFWRISLDAAIAHPIGGLGQDNFADYYVSRRHTAEEPSWTHSLEMRLLAHTGFVGLLLFAAFLACALAAARRAVRGRGALAPAVAGVALLPVVVWLIHGSVDWFWEIPALTGPALGFLAMAIALEGSPTAPIPGFRSPAPRWGRIAVATTVLAASVAVLGFPYLALREVSAASAARSQAPLSALRDLARAALLNPLSAEPGRVAGTIALQDGQFTEAERRFSQATAREPGGWFAWLGDGLAASALGDSPRAERDFRIADSINSRQPAVRQALARVNTTRPLTPPEAFSLLVLAQ